MYKPVQTRLLESLALHSHGQRWLLGDQNLIRAMWQKIPMKRGVRGRLINFFLAIAELIHMHYLALAVFGILETSRLWIVHYFHSIKYLADESKNYSNNRYRIFVTCEVRAEKHLFDKYRSLSTLPIIKIGQDDMRSLRKLPRIGFSQLFGTFWQNFRAVRKFHSGLPAEFDVYRLDWLTWGAMRLAKYSFYCSFWDSIGRKMNIAEVNFLAADTAAFAAVEVGLPTSYQQHGLLSSSVWLPCFDRIQTLSLTEAQYIGAMLPNAVISCRDAIDAPGSNKSTRNVIFISELRTQEDLSLIREVIDFFCVYGYIVFVRPAPGLTGLNSEQFWKSTIKDGTWPVSLCGTVEGFDELLLTLKPNFVVACISTTLCDSLYSGYLPISIAFENDIYIADTVFPLGKVCLNWHRDRPLIISLAMGNADPNRVRTMLLDREISSCV